MQRALPWRHPPRSHFASYDYQGGSDRIASIDLHNRGVSTSIWFSKACQLARTANSLAGRGDDPNGYSLGIVWQNPPELRVLPRLAYCSRMPITLFFGIVGGERPNTAL